jgi:hypothetical protein
MLLTVLAASAPWKAARLFSAAMSFLLRNGVEKR